jgi:tetratricopeptide (TPR) repeat protein
MSQVEALLENAASAVERGSLPEAKTLVDRALVADVAWPMRGHVLHAAAQVYGYCGELQQSLAFWEAFLSEAGDAGNGVRLAKVYEGWYNYGVVLRQAHREYDAIAAYRKALAWFRQHGPEEHVFACLVNLAWAACTTDGDVATASQALAESEPLATTPDRRYQQALGVAFLHHMNSRQDDALNDARTLLNDEQAPADVRSQAAWLIGQVWLYHENCDEAAKMAEIAAEFAGRVTLPYRLAHDAETLKSAIDGKRVH